MCGLAGFLDLSAQTPDRASVVAAMAGTLVHRGPDDKGAWVDDAAGFALGFRRLAILDLSPQGHQPMVSGDGRWVIAFNGEIYNHAELRDRLQPAGWRGHSDTEVLLEAVSRWGIEQALTRCDGMFAIALWDRAERTLHLARDRIGEKPLYYAQAGGVLTFGSELKALAVHPSFDRTIDRQALALFMQLGWIAAPHTIYAAARKLMPGTILTVTGGGALSVRSYWSAPDRARAVAGTFTGGAAAAGERLDQLLRSSVALRMQADVPVGVFLSGGIDSSLMAAIMQQMSGQAIHTFTIGFDQPGYDESPHARAVADYLGTRHTEVPITDDDALALVPDLPTIWDEPFADPAQLPTCLLARATRRDVTVALSGDGADELFGGYGIYRSLPRDWRRLDGVPPWLRRLAAGLDLLPASVPNAAARLGALVGRRRRSYPGFRMKKAFETLRAGSLGELHGQHYARWRGMPSPVLGARPAPTAFSGTGLPETDDPALAVMVMDARTYLPDDLCVKTDRATMACSLEARLPFLDHAVVEFAWSLPTDLKIAGDTGKAVLREVLYRHVPRALVDRPKMGFEVPIGRWLNGQLRDWAGDLLNEDRLRRQGLLDAGLIGACWRDHRGGAKNWQTQLWHALMFQAWFEGQG
jgi:asparagine synthase (glutamine-hydrolysing)